MGKITIRTNRIWLFAAYSLWFAIALIRLMAAFENMAGGGETYNDGFLYLILDLVCLLYIMLTARVGYPKLIVAGALLLLVQIMGMLLAKTSGLTVMVMRTALWVLVMIALYKYLTRNPTTIDFFIKLSAIGLIILSLYIVERSYYIRNTIQYDAGMNEVYNVLFLTPLLFLLKSNNLCKVGLVAVGLMVLNSMKLTAIAALAIGLTVYAIINGRVKQQQLNKGLIVILILLVLIWMLFPVINEYLLRQFNVDWGDKILSASETGGSGRTDIWVGTLKLQMRSSIGQWLVGHGYNSVVAGLDHSAHNDFLEVLYDFGLVGMMIYVGVYYYLIKTVGQLIKSREKSAAALGMFTTMFFTVSMFSHIVIVPDLLVSCAMVWTVCLLKKQPPVPEEDGIGSSSRPQHYGTLH